MPSCVRVQIVEGRFSLNGFSGSITADVRRGPIEAVELQGEVRLETGIGDVIADQMRLTPQGLLRLRAFNGDVRLTLAEKPVDARILALALNGSIKSDIPLQMKDTWGPRWGEATLGKGEPVISIDVITGTIEIAIAARRAARRVALALAAVLVTRFSSISAARHDTRDELVGGTFA